VVEVRYGRLAGCSEDGEQNCFEDRQDRRSDLEFGERDHDLTA
jgi:hypothetical protein